MADIVVIPEGGTFQVCRVERTVIGSFPHFDDAEFFKDALKARETGPTGSAVVVSGWRTNAAAPSAKVGPESAVSHEPEGSDDPRTADPPQPATESVENASAPDSVANAGQSEEIADAPEAEADAVAPSEAVRPLPPDDSAVVPVPDAPLPADLPSSKTHPALFAQAQARLMDGDPMSEVADDLGIPFGRLRGWWASRKKHGTRGGHETLPAKVARTEGPRFSDQDDLELLSIAGSATAKTDLSAWASENGIPVMEAQRQQERLLARGRME